MENQIRTLNDDISKKILNTFTDYFFGGVKHLRFGDIYYIQDVIINSYEQEEIPLTKKELKQLLFLIEFKIEKSKDIAKLSKYNWLKDNYIYAVGLVGIIVMIAYIGSLSLMYFILGILLLMVLIYVHDRLVFYINFSAMDQNMKYVKEAIEELMVVRLEPFAGKEKEEKLNYMKQLDIYKLNKEQKELIYEITRYKHLEVETIHYLMEQHNRQFLAITFEYYHELECPEVLEILQEKKPRTLLKKYSQSSNKLVQKNANELLKLNEIDTNNFFYHIQLSIDKINNNS